MGRFLYLFRRVTSGLAAAKAVGAPHELDLADSIGASVAALDIVSVINTQKTIDDHIVSCITGKDCSDVRASKGDPYCIDEPVPVPMVRRATYCYKSLASVTCYDRPVVSDAAQFYGIRVDNVPSIIR